MNITGGCHCGRLRYEAEIDPATAGICHCTECQVVSGTAYRLTVRAKPGTLRFTAGAPKIYVKTAESGRKREQAFCENCGSPIYASAFGPDPSKIYSLRAG